MPTAPRNPGALYVLPTTDEWTEELIPPVPPRTSNVTALVLGGSFATVQNTMLGPVPEISYTDGGGFAKHTSEPVNRGFRLIPEPSASALRGIALATRVGVARLLRARRR